MPCKHFFVSGLVQGVFFRSWTQKKAQELKLTGWVRNLPDGRVEGLVVGDADKIAILEKALKAGPSSATVTHVEIFEEPPGKEEYWDFKILS